MSILSAYGRRVIGFINAYTPWESLQSGKHIPMMAAEITGSVGVRQADIAKQEIKLRDGKSSKINPGEICAG